MQIPSLSNGAKLAQGWRARLLARRGVEGAPGLLRLGDWLWALGVLCGGVFWLCAGDRPN